MSAIELHVYYIKARQCLFLEFTFGLSHHQFLEHAVSVLAQYRGCVCVCSHSASALFLCTGCAGAGN